MPNRILRDGVLTSERVNSLTWPAEVFYRRLMSVVDDFGRFYAKPELIRAACYPLQLDKVGNQDVAKWLGETQKAGLVMVYTVEGKAYLELLNFKQQVRALKSKFPCQAGATHVLVNGGASAHLDVVGDVDEDVGGSGNAPNGARPALKDESQILLTLPLRDGSEFDVRQSLVAELEPLYPAVDVPQTIREMKGWLISKPERRKTRRGVRAFITGWLKEEQAKHGS